MKNIFFISAIVFLAFLSCRNDEKDIQQIDQVINLYIDSAGRDMLNSKIPGSYISIKMNDVYGLRDNAPVSFTTKKTSDTINYIEYLAGARRVGVDSSGTTKTYRSKITLIMTKKINDSTSATTNDVMTINYTYTPQLFQISKIWYNDVLKFTKVEGQPNIVKISK